MVRVGTAIFGARAKRERVTRGAGLRGAARHVGCGAWRSRNASRSSAPATWPARLIEGLIAAGTCPAARIVATDVRADAVAALACATASAARATTSAAARAADVIVLSTKPQVFPTILPELAPVIGKTSS